MPTAHQLDLVDLDSTLTTSRAEEVLVTCLLDEMHRYFPQMTRAELVRFNHEQAYLIYGSTAAYMEIHHGIPQARFMRSVYQRFHRLAQKQNLYPVNMRLQRTFKKYPRPRVLFTASPLFHAEFVLQEMGLRIFFDEIIAVDHPLVDGQKKHAADTLEKVLLYVEARYGVPRHAIVMYDDKSAVIEAAHQARIGLCVQIRDRFAAFHDAPSSKALFKARSMASALERLAAL